MTWLLLLLLDCRTAWLRNRLGGHRALHVYTFAYGAWKEKDLLEILPEVDAIEVFNSRCMDPRFNRDARAFAEKHDVPGTVGSDAHAAFEVGRSVLRLEPFEDADGLRRVIRAGIPITKWSPPWIHLTSRYATVTKKFQTRS